MALGGASTGFPVRGNDEQYAAKLDIKRTVFTFTARDYKEQAWQWISRKSDINQYPSLGSIMTVLEFLFCSFL